MLTYYYFTNIRIAVCVNILLGNIFHCTNKSHQSTTMHLKLLILVVLLSFCQIHYNVFTFDMYTYIEKSLASCHYDDNILNRKGERSRNVGAEHMNKGNVIQWDLMGKRISLISRLSLIDMLKSYIICVMSYWKHCTRLQTLDVFPTRYDTRISRRPCFLAKLVLSVVNFSLEIQVNKMFHLRLRFGYFTTQYASINCTDQYVMVSVILNSK